jgi:hypothetical protein
MSTQVSGEGRGIWRPKVIAALTVLALLGGAALTNAEIDQQGNLRVAVSGGLSPHNLPRTGVAPIAVSIGGKITTTDDSVVPPLKRLRIELNRHGRLDTEGLPECRIAQIQPASSARALKACREALVGNGTFSVQVVLSQQPYPTTGRLLVFNGKYKGRPTLLGQIYSAHPFANSFVIPFVLHEIKKGAYGTALTATLPPGLTSWGHVTGLNLRLQRIYRYRGRRHSFVSAGCPAPKGFPGALFLLARTSFHFAGGKSLNSTPTRNCGVRG